MKRGSLSPFLRGAATVELALLSLVFVTVLLFGIHFAELGALKLRVQQAGVFALWSGAGDRGHRLAGASPLFFDANALKDGAGKTPSEAARDRYRDFDSVRWATTRGSNLGVRCEPQAIAVQPQTVAMQRLAPGYHYARFGGRDVDAISCTAQARIELFGVPPSFVDGPGGFFKEEHRHRPGVNVCAFGRADHGTCIGGIPLAVDDWGLQGSLDDESGECNFNCTLLGGGNQPYKRTVERLYAEYAQVNSVGNWNIQNFVRQLFTVNPPAPTLMVQVPVDARDFRFAFIGDRDTRPFQISTREVDAAAGGNGPTRHRNYHWATSPYSSRYRAGYDDRGDCFGGLPCDRPAFDKQHW